MVVPWLVIALLPLVDPGRTAAIWGFWKVTPLAEAVTVSPRMTPVASKFNLLTEAVITSMYCLSSSVWLDRTMGLVNLTTNALVGTTGATTSVGPVAWPDGKSFGASPLGLVERTAASPSSGGSPRPGRVCLTSSTVGRAISSISGVSSLSEGLNSKGVVSCAPWASAEFSLCASSSCCGGLGS